MAVSGRPLGAIWAAYFVCSKRKSRDLGERSQSFDRGQLRVPRIRQFDHGSAANLHELLFSSNWSLLVKFVGEFANGSQTYAGQVGRQ